MFVLDGGKDDNISDMLVSTGDDLSERKRLLLDNADAVIVLPVLFLMILLIHFHDHNDDDDNADYFDEGGETFLPADHVRYISYAYSVFSPLWPACKMP